MKLETTYKIKSELANSVTGDTISRMVQECSDTPERAKQVKQDIYDCVDKYCTEAYLMGLEAGRKER